MLETLSLVSQHHHHDPSFYRPGMKLSPNDASKIVEELSGENALAKLPKLRLDVFDYDKFSKNDFMGQKTFSDNEMLQILFEQNEEPVRNFFLEPKKARGVLGMKLGIVKKDKAESETGEESSTLILQITDGKHLPKADPFSLSDPYCIVKWNDEQVGKTKIIKNTLDPLWNHAYFEMKLTAGSEDKEIEEGVLVIEVFDWDRIGGDDRLGILTFKGKEIKELVEKSAATADMAIDDNVLRVIEEEWTRLEGTPKQSDFKVNILHKIDLKAQEEREKLKEEHEAEKMRILQEKIDAGLETPEERRLRKTMDKEKRRKERATNRAAKVALKKELRKRGMATMADRASRDTRDTRDTRATQGDSLSAMLAAAKAEVEQEIEKGVDFEKSEEYKVPNLEDDEGSLDSKGVPKASRASRHTRKSHRRGSRGSKQGRRGSLMHELPPNVLAAMADNPDLMLGMIKKGELELDKDQMKAGERGSRMSRGSRESKDSVENEEDEEAGQEGEEGEGEGGEGEEEEESDDESLIEEGYEPGTCIAFSNVLGVKCIFEDDDGFEIIQREEWIKLADVPLNIKMGKNPELEEIWRRLELEKQPMWKKIIKGKAKIYAEMDEQKAQQLGWLDKMMGRKNLGLKTYYPLFLPDAESGAKDVQGKIGLRMVYHTRGMVLRGIDEVVSEMSLGERCMINIREDYAFGQVFGNHNLPPHSDINVEVDLVGVRGLGGLYLLISRNASFLMYNLWLFWQLVIIIYERLICYYEKLLCPLWCKNPWVKQKTYDINEDDADDFDEEAMLQDESLVKSEEGKSVEVKEEEEKNESTLGARMLFANF